MDDGLQFGESLHSLIELIALAVQPVTLGGGVGVGPPGVGEGPGVGVGGQRSSLWDTDNSELDWAAWMEVGHKTGAPQDGLSNTSTPLTPNPSQNTNLLNSALLWFRQKLVPKRF